MKKTIILLSVYILLASFVAGCDALQVIAPLPQPTVVPSPTAIIITPTPLPTLGELEYLDAAYCLNEDSIDDEHNLLRFFPSGVVLQVTVQGHDNCQETWDYIAPYLIETAADTFSHGEYQFSAPTIQFTLAPPHSEQAAGMVTGRYEVDKLLLQQQGVAMEYILVYGGQQP